MINFLKNLPWKTILISIITAVMVVLLFTPPGQALLALFGISTMGVFVAKFLFNALVSLIPSLFTFMPQIFASVIIAAGTVLAEAAIYFMSTFVGNFISRALLKNCSSYLILKKDQILKLARD